MSDCAAAGSAARTAKKSSLIANIMIAAAMNIERRIRSFLSERDFVPGISQSKKFALAEVVFYVK